MERLKQEIRIFLACPHNMRVLLVTNMIFNLAMPVIYTFISTYVLRNSLSVGKVLIYQLASYTGIPFTFLINGWLLKHFQIRWIYATGMMLCGISMIILMTLTELDVIGLIVVGLIMGIAFGLYWANRDFLALSTTNDGNRNYYYGLEQFFGLVTGMVVPLFVGWFLAEAGHWLGAVDRGYDIVTASVFVVAILSSVVLQSGRFDNPPRSRFVYFRYHQLWYRFLALAALKGLGQGYTATAPAMLAMRFLGKEGTLGTIQSAGVLCSAFLLYYLGRKTRPEHRVAILALGLALFAFGGIANALLFDAAGALIFMLCLVPAGPLLDFTYFPIELRVVDAVSAIEGRNKFAYLFNHEFGLYLGRFFGCGLFILLVYKVSDIVALRYALLIIGIVQLVSVSVARKVLTQADVCSEDKPAITAGPLTAADPAA